MNRTSSHRPSVHRLLLAALALTLLSLGPLQAVAPMYLINVDPVQSFVKPQDNYEIELKGDWTHIPLDDIINAFPNGSIQVSFNGTNTVISFFGDPIAKSRNSVHFGFGANLKKDNTHIVKQYWTRGPEGSGVPSISTRYFPNQVSAQTLVMFSNDTADTVRIVDTATWTFPTPVPLALLDRQGLPPSSGAATSVPAGTVVPPGGSVWTTVTGVAPGYQVVAFVEVEFVQPTNGYTDTVGIWTGWND